MPLILCGSPIISPKQLNYDRNSITGFLLYTMFLWSGSCPSIKEADTSLGTELSWPFISSPSPSHIRPVKRCFQSLSTPEERRKRMLVGCGPEAWLTEVLGSNKASGCQEEILNRSPSSASSHPLITTHSHPFSSPSLWFPCGPPFDLSVETSPSSVQQLG